MTKKDAFSLLVTSIEDGRPTPKNITRCTEALAVLVKAPAVATAPAPPAPVERYPGNKPKKSKGKK